MTREEIESRQASKDIRAWFREQVLESIKPLQAGKRRPVFRPPHVEIAMNHPWAKRKGKNETAI